MKKLFFIICLLALIGSVNASVGRDLSIKKADFSKTRNMSLLRDQLNAYAWDVTIVNSDLSTGPVEVSKANASVVNLCSDDSLFIAGADWIKDQWVGIQFQTHKLFNIDPVTGEKTEIAVLNLVSELETGLAYDVQNNKLYLTTVSESNNNSKLYEVNLSDYSLTEKGIIYPQKSVIGIAINNSGVLYGIETNTDKLISINTENATPTEIGPLNTSINFAQDIAFDRDNNKLYGTLYRLNTGSLFEINTDTGNAILIGEFGDEIDGFAIPYAESTQNTVTATIVDSESDNPVVNASVQFGPYRTLTNESGSFSLNVNSGKYTLKISADNYETYLQRNIVINQNTTIEAIEMINTEAISAPVNLNGVITNNQVVLSWQHTDNSITSFKLFRDHQEIGESDSLSYTDQNLSDGYHLYYVKAVKNNSISEPSADISVKIGDYINRPENLTYTLDNHTVQLSWEAPRNTILKESFENEFPPNGWTVRQKNINEEKYWTKFAQVVWNSQTVDPTDGNFQAGVKWGNQGQDEWLISPEFIAQGVLSFDFYGVYGSEHGDHYYVKVSQDKGLTWSVLWDASAENGTNTYTSPVNINLNSYNNTPVKLAWHIVDGDNGGVWHSTFIDNVQVNSDTRALTGYKVYRNNQQIASLSADILTYNDLVSSDNNTYSYKIAAVYGNAESSFSDSVNVSILDNNEVILVKESINNYPNPFNPNTTISFDLKQSSHVKVSVYNVKGELVKVINDSDLTPGRKQINWNGTDKYNNTVSAGIYFYSVKTNEDLTVKKMLMLK